MRASMELAQGDEMMTRYNTYDLSSGSSSTRWYLKKRNVRLMIAGLVIILVAAGIFLAGYYLGLGAVLSSSEPVVEVFEPTPTPTTTTEPPPVIWSGTCPLVSSKCPDSFQGIPPLLLVSLDGFRPDYLDEHVSPTLHKIFDCGTSAPFMYPVYPSKTFCNHFSQVTGLYPSSHGIIDNSMYDPVKQEFFRPGNADPFWWKKEPIWTTLEKQGKKTALYFWPGSEVNRDGVLPTYFKDYEKKVPFVDRVDQVLDWLELPSYKKPSFLTLYFNEPDSAGHKYGTEANETKQAVANIDKMIARLFSGLQQRQMLGCVNIIIMSDHGMADINCDQVVEIQRYTNASDMYSYWGTFGRLRPSNDSTAAIENIVEQLECKHSHFRVYKKEQLPVRLHYADNVRIEPVIVDLDSGWFLTNTSETEYQKFCPGGAHGYDNLYPDMRAIFMAYGPSFKENNRVRPFINTELYELMTELVNITANPNNGTTGSLHHLLTSPIPLPEETKPEPPPIAKIPTESDEYNFLVFAASCPCHQTYRQSMVENVTESNALHLPFGVPHSSELEADLELLYHVDYIAAYDMKYRLPMWSSFTLNGTEDITPEEMCWTGDARVGKTETSECVDYVNELVENENILQRPLYPPYFSSNLTVREQARHVTNSVPKHLNHTTLLEEQFYSLLNQWADDSQLNVIMGPAFDIDATGLKPDIGTIMQSHAQFGPLVVPTHYFAVVTWCDEMTQELTACNSSSLETTAFLLPNVPFPMNCEPAKNIIAKNTARVVDVEKLTGLSFFTDLPVYEAIRLRTMVPTRVPR